MKILACGDTHGNTSALCNIAIPQAKKNGCEYIVQCGDFGYWEHQQDGVKFLNKVSKSLVRENIVMYWLDGNHENHPLLWEKYPENEDGFCEVRPNLFYLPRGKVWKFGDVTCLALGGAFSIDKEWRVAEELAHGPLGGRFSADPRVAEEQAERYSRGDYEHTLWWPTEMTTKEDGERAIRHAMADGPVDIMFTHDCPEGTDIPGIHSVDKWRWPQTWQNREILRNVFDAVQPKLLIHGHYHERYTSKLPLSPKVGNGDLLEWDYCRVDGLANDGRPGFAVILDLDSLFLVES